MTEFREADLLDAYKAALDAEKPADDAPPRARISHAASSIIYPILQLAMDERKKGTPLQAIIEGIVGVKR
jgi:hypothetical protein